MEDPHDEARLFAILAALAPLTAQAEPSALGEENHLELLTRLLSPSTRPEEGRAILERIAESKDTRFVAGLIGILRYHWVLKQEITDVLNKLTSQELLPDWKSWVKWAGSHSELESFDNYPKWKAHLLTHLDPEFVRFVGSDVRVAQGSRLEEIVWGGVQVDGIPALDNPRMVDPEDAD